MTRELPEGRVLVTGATGFVGGAFVRRLLGLGVAPGRLVCLVRDPARAERQGLPPESLVAADLGARDPAKGLADAARGVAVVVHLAGTLKALDATGYDEVNVVGTRRLIAAVGEAAPEAHFVLVSSLAAAGPSLDGVGSDALPAQCRPVSSYGDSKRRGELEVLAGHNPWTILRPPVVYGPGDAATRLLFRQANAPLTAVPPRPSPLSVIHAEDVVDALLLALQHRPRGAVIPLDGPERTDTHALMRAIAAASGRRARLVKVPLAVAALAANISDAFARLRGVPGYFNRDKVRELRAPGWVADGAPARRTIAFEPRISLAEGLAAVARAEGFTR